MAATKVLVPYNFSVHEWKAFDFVISILRGRDDVTITLFNTYVPVPEIDLTGNPELQKMRGGLIFLSEELKRKEQGLNSAVKYFLQHGFSEHQVDFLFKKKEKDVADEIIDAVVKGRYDMVVLRPTPGKVSRLFARSVHERVLRSLQDVAVCIAT